MTMPLFASRQTGLEALLHRPRLSAWQRFLRQPCVFLAHKLYTWRAVTPPEPLAEPPVSVVCISDTHNTQSVLPDGDVLVHAGDLTQSGSFDELKATIEWLGRQPHSVKVVVAGNHDLLLDADLDSCKSTGTASGPEAAGRLRESLPWKDIIYLDNQQITVTCPNGRRLCIYGSPHSPRHGNWAFQYPRSHDIWANTVPSDVDILITHGPPRAHLDLLNLGCVHLLRELWRVRPWLHVFGHVHEGAGAEWLLFDGLQDAFERTVVAGGGVGNLLSVVVRFVTSLVGARAGREATTLLVNPSMVGGLRDAELRQPIKLWI